MERERRTDASSSWEAERRNGSLSEPGRSVASSQAAESRDPEVGAAALRCRFTGDYKQRTLEATDVCGQPGEPRSIVAAGEPVLLAPGGVAEGTASWWSEGFEPASWAQARQAPPARTEGPAAREGECAAAQPTREDRDRFSSLCRLTPELSTMARPKRSSNDKAIVLEGPWRANRQRSSTADASPGLSTAQSGSNHRGFRSEPYETRCLKVVDRSRSASRNHAQNHRRYRQ